MSDDSEKWIFYAAVAFGFYLLWQKLSGTLFSSSGAVPSLIGGAFSPGYTQTTTYLVIFPDGSSHRVDSSQVNADGSFTYNGTAYMLAQGAGGNAAYIPTIPTQAAGTAPSGTMMDALASG